MCILKIKNCIFLVCIIILASCRQPTLNVICIGDSITHGKVVNDSISELSYRFWLWEKLDSAGYKVDMVGSNKYWFNENTINRVKLPVSQYTGNIFDNDHDSYYGITTGKFILGGFTQDNITYQSFHERLSVLNKPDVAFIHIGSNDDVKDSAQTINYIKQIVEEIYAYSPEIKILLAKLNTPWIRFVNHAIEPVIAELKIKYPGLKIKFVDMASGWINCPDETGTYTLDWEHPNTAGQKVMADKWFKAFMSMDDTVQPEFKGNIKISEITDTTVVVNWDRASDNGYVAGYNIYLDDDPVNWRYSECGGGEKQCISLVPVTSYKLTRLQKGKNYRLSVTALDYGNNSTLSEFINFETGH